MIPFRSAAVMILTMLGAPIWAEAQNPLPLIGVDVDLGDYGIDAPDSVVRGRVSIAYAPDGPRLVTYFLRDTPPPPRRPPETGDPSAPLPPLVEPAAGEQQRALWVWNTAEILEDRVERYDFLDFIENQAITRVFLYLPAAEGERPAAGYIPFDGSELGPLLSDLRDRGALVYALDGDKDYVRRENHAGIYRTVERLIEHNRSVPPWQRFHGVRYDIEPYLAPGFQGPERQEILNLYVEVIAGVASRARAGHLAVAVDIPFWFDSPDEETGEYLLADFDGERRGVLEHVMSLVDNIAIMDYRTSAEGPNGALAHAQGELAMGAKTGVGVFVGVETTRLLDEDMHTFFGHPVDGLPTRGNARWIVLEVRPEGKGRLWLVDSEVALQELAERAEGATFLRHWPAGRPARVPADMQSFFNLGREPMERVTGEVVEKLSKRTAFIGLAFHDYIGLRQLLRNR